VPALLIAIATKTAQANDLKREIKLKIVLELRNLAGLQYFVKFASKFGIGESGRINVPKLTVHTDVDLAGIGLEMEVRTADLYAGF
jgi:hypothetical protein